MKKPTAAKAMLRAGNTTPGGDGVTVKLLKAAWPHIKDAVRRLYEGCLRTGYHPKIFRNSDVAIIKPGKDHITPKGWRPIALLCIGMERLVPRR